MSKTILEDAIRFISQELKEDPAANKLELIERASRKFDLNPLQADFLINKYVYEGNSDKE